jgi:hypothetical protein
MSDGGEKGIVSAVGERLRDVDRSCCLSDALLKANGSWLGPTLFPF